MKKLILSLVILFGVLSFSNAQVNPHAIGLRLGGSGDIFGGEVSYQHGLGDANRLEFDLGLGSNVNYSHLYLTGTYQWDWNITEGLNWYIGPGAGLGIYSVKNAGSVLGLQVGGQIGLEYDFKTLGAPILVSLDARPMWGFASGYNGLGWGAALGVRYVW